MQRGAPVASRARQVVFKQTIRRMLTIGRMPKNG